MTYEMGARVEYTASPVFDRLVQTGDIGIVTRVEAGWVSARWPLGEYSVPLAHVRPHSQD